MRSRPRPANDFFSLGIAALLLTALTGCSQTQYRKQADQEAYQVIAERNQDPRWSLDRVSIDADPRSRFFDDQDPDHSAMPIDDPASASYMRQVNGIDGWKKWFENGVRSDLENPQWRQQISGYAELNADGDVQLSVDSALRLAYMHSPLHQSNLETVYLSSLDVTAQRFRLDTQFFGGSGTSYVHRGDINPVAISYSAPLGGYVVSGPFEKPEANRFSIPSDLQARRRLATAGEVLVGFANSFTWDFTGSDASLGSSLANFSFVQPLLRGAGKQIALEQLTQSERRLLANLRAYAQFRQGFFTQVVIGELGVTGPQRFGTSTQLQSYSGFGGVGGYLGLLQQSQQIRNTEENLRLQLRTRDRLEALYDNELIDIVQVDQFRQNIEVTRANLLDQTNSLELSVDNYKTQVMGLPADLAVSVDESLVSDFQLIPLESNEIVDSLLDLQRTLGEISQLVELRARVTELEENLADAIAAASFEASVFEESLSRLNQSVERLNPASGKDDEERTDAKDSSEPSTAEMTSEEVGDALALVRDSIEEQLIGFDIEQQPASVFDSAKSHMPLVDAMRLDAEKQMQRLEEVAQIRERTMGSEEKIRFSEDRKRLQVRLDDLTKGENSMESAKQAIDAIEEELEGQPIQRTLSALTAWVQDYLQIVERLSLIPAQARLEVITVEEVELTPEQAFEIALTHRLDFMNGRAALVDRWRAIEIAANELESNLSITGNWDIGTARNNMLDLRGGTSNLQLGLEFDAPLARLLERNGYRETLIEFQRSRRQLIQSRDSLQKGLRALLRTLKQRRLQLEIQRRAVSIALRRVEQTQLSLLTPPPPIQPGSRPQINPTTAINLLAAQGSLQTSQNSFLAAWLNYYAARLRLYRELGVMELDAEGQWVENPLSEATEEAVRSLQPVSIPISDESPGETLRIGDSNNGRTLPSGLGNRAEEDADIQVNLRSAALPTVLEFPVR